MLADDVFDRTQTGGRQAAGYGGEGRAVDGQVLKPQLEPAPEFGRDIHADPA
jgi:hypothetical protein